MKKSLIVFALVASSGIANVASADGTYEKSMMNRMMSKHSAAGFTSNYIKNNTIGRAIPTYNYSTANRGLLTSATGSGFQSAQKPFSSYQRSSGLSPYMGLLSNNPYTSTTDNYFNIVRPQMEQQKTNAQLEQRNAMLQKQLNDVAAKGPYNPQGATDRAPTGHASVYFNYGGFYTPVQPHGVRGRR